MQTNTQEPQDLYRSDDTSLGLGTLGEKYWGYPSLVLKKPDGQEYTIDLKTIFGQNPEKTRLTIGRSHDNDIVLTDPHKKVSRQHCIIGWESGRWQLIDEGSANGTFLRQRNCDGTEVDVRSVDTIPLHDGDTILILGKLINSQEPVFWQLTFHDPNQTDAVYDFQAPAELVYDFREQRLFQVNRQERTEIRLSPQERSLIHRLAQCNQNNNDQPTVCEHQELIKAVWKEPFGHTSNDIAALVFGIREKIESDSGEPQYLKTERGQGYLLNVRIQ